MCVVSQARSKHSHTEEASPSFLIIFTAHYNRTQYIYTSIHPLQPDDYHKTESLKPTDTRAPLYTDNDVSLCSVFSFTLWHCGSFGLMRFTAGKHRVSWFSRIKHGWKMSLSLLKNIQMFHTHKCWNCWRVRGHHGAARSFFNILTLSGLLSWPFSKHRHGAETGLNKPDRWRRENREQLSGC